MHKVHRTVALVLRIPFAFPMKASNEAVSLVRAVFGYIDDVLSGTGKCGFLSQKEEKKEKKNCSNVISEYPLSWKVILLLLFRMDRLLILRLSFFKFSHATRRDMWKDRMEDEAISAHLFRVNIPAVRHLRR